MGMGGHGGDDGAAGILLGARATGGTALAAHLMLTRALTIAAALGASSGCGVEKTDMSTMDVVTPFPRQVANAAPDHANAIVRFIRDDGQVVLGVSFSETIESSELFRWRQTHVTDHLGFPPGIDPNTAVFGIGSVSADGSTVVGVVTDATHNSTESVWFRWNESSGMQSIGAFAPLMPGDIALLNMDGSVLVTNRRGGSTIRWSEPDGLQDLGVLPGDVSSFPVAVSADGQVIFGNSQSVDKLSVPFRWTADAGMVGLGHPTGMVSCTTSGASANGSAVTGICVEDLGSSTSTMFRWTQAAGLEAGTLPPGFTTGTPGAMTPDGRTIAGWLQPAIATSAAVPFRWQQGSDVIALPLPSGFGSCTQSVKLSDDGRILFANCYGSQPTRAIRWVDNSVGTILAAPSGFTDIEINSISADGRQAAGATSHTLPDRTGASNAILWDEGRGVRFARAVVSTPWVDQRPFDLLTADISRDGSTLVGYGGPPGGGLAVWIAAFR
jgi:uncharacterized membrane protein